MDEAAQAGDAESIDDVLEHIREEHEAELDVSADSPALAIFAKIHPAGIVAAATMVVSLLFTVLSDTERLVGNLALWQWVVLAAIVALSLQPQILNRVRLAIELIGGFMPKILWVMAWLVFFVQMINVVTRYLNPSFSSDILIGELTSVAWQLFALIALLGLPYGVKAAVNPRIDFWWADWSDRKKAWLDFVMHTFFFLPFLYTMCGFLIDYAAGALGRKRGDGTWPDGWQVWNSWEVSTDADQLPLGPIKAAILLGFVLFALQIAAEIIKTGFVLAGNREYGDIASGDEFQRIE